MEFDDPVWGVCDASDDGGHVISSLWPLLLRLTIVEIGVLVFILMITSIAGWRQLNRHGIFRIIGMGFTKSQWVLVSLGITYLAWLQLERIGVSLAHTIATTINATHIIHWEIVKTGTIVLLTVIIKGLPWARLLNIGGRPGQSKQVPQVSNQIYVTSPESLASTIQKELTRDEQKADNSMKSSRNLEQVLQENVTTQNLILGQLAAVNKYIEGLQMTLPSANFLAFSLDEFSSRIEERLDDFAEIMNVYDGPINHSNGGELDQNSNKGREKGTGAGLGREEDEERNGRKGEQTGKGGVHSKTKAHDSHEEDQLGTEDEESEENEINTANLQWKRVKKDPSKKPPAPKAKISRPLSQEEAKNCTQMTEDELFELLQKKRRERREEARKPVFLTEEEKKLSVTALDKHWREQEQRERLSRRKQDEVELGTLTEEEKRLPRSELKFLIRQKKEAAWIKRMQDRKVPLFRCEVCSQVTTTNHRCAATSWATQGTKRLVPITEEIIFQQVGTGDIKLKRIQRTDKERIQQQHQVLTEQLKKNDDENKRLTNLLTDPVVDPPASTTFDIVIEDSTNDQAKAAPPGINTTQPVVTGYPVTCHRTYPSKPTFLH
jgi:hypothetical protein